MDQSSIAEGIARGITEGMLTGLYKAFEIVFLTPPTCYMFYGMIALTVILKIIKIIIKKNKRIRPKQEHCYNLSSGSRIHPKNHL